MDTTLDLWPRKARQILKEKHISVRKLKSQFKCQIIFPWDNNYDQQRMLYSTQIQERPLFIIRVQSEDAIIEILNLLPIYQLTIRIVGGRHSTALQNPDIFLDISLLNKIRFSKDKQYLEVEGGAIQGSVNDFLFQHSQKYHFPCGHPNRPNSLAFSGGSAATVGVAGISTIGGIGTLRRTLGLTVDSIRSIRIILPPRKDRKAKVVVASSTHHSSLFWALLGGLGSNFGVVTLITYYPLKIGKVILYEMKWEWDQAVEVLNQWQVTAPTRTNAFNEDLAIFNIDPTRFGINLTGVYVIPSGQTIEDAKQIVFNTISTLGGDIHIEEATRYVNVYNQFAGGRVYHNFSIGKGILTTTTIPGEILVTQLEKARDMIGFAYIGLQLMGGKIAEVPSDATAYYPRDAKFFIDIFNFWDSPVDQATNIIWNSKTFKNIYKITGPYVYLGFPIPNLPDYLNAYYGQNKDRLLRIKHRVDPLNLLKFPGSL